jgi:hypothetical protein
MQAFIDHAKAIGNRSLHDPAVIIPEAGFTTLVIQQLETAEMSEGKSVNILHPGFKPTATRHKMTVQLWQTVGFHRFALAK